jgi:hypothetical protein
MTTMQVAFKRSGYKVRKQMVRWPRVKGPRAVAVDCSKMTVKNVVFLTKEENKSLSS